jgi:UDP-glucuronate decarboxylase
LVRRLDREAKSLRVVDDHSTGRSGFKQLGLLSFIADVTIPGHIPTFALKGLKEIYHLACPASPAFYQADPIKTLETNFLGTLNILRIAEETGAKVLFTSTSEIYGEPKEHPQFEAYRGNVNTMGPRACYDEGKRVAETLCYEFMQRGVDIKVARLFNTYGPYMAQNDGRVVSNFIMQALRGEKLTINGDGNQTRSFCYVDDTVDALIRLMGSDFQGVMNIGNPHEITINELADAINAMIGSDFEVEAKAMPQDDPSRRCPDISTARRVLGWEPRTPLRAGLEKTVAYFRDAYKSDQVQLSRVG